MLVLQRTTSDNADFLELVKALDLDLAIRDGDDHAFYAQFNKTAKLKYVIVAYQDDQPVGCGALRDYEPGTMEIKRMYVIPDQRGKGIASRVLTELETWCRELGIEKCILETGMNQPEAIHLYGKNGYERVPNYGPYQTVENSVCFMRSLAQ